MLQAILLGHFAIRLDGQPVVLASRPAQSILAFLLLHPNAAHRREKLAGLFWPDASESNARSNLRHALWRIRKVVNSTKENRLTADDLVVTYHPGSEDQLDVETFESCAECESSPDLIIQSASAYNGDLLPGFYEDWVVLERARLQGTYERRLSRLLDCLLVEKRWNEVLVWAERWIALGAFPEPAYRALMLAHAGLGNLAGAAAQYQRCQDSLSRELGVEPSELTRTVFEQIQAGKIEAVIALPPITESPRPISITEPETPAPIFVGRNAQLDALDGYLQKVLSGRLQVVFVSGEAGSGKTALLQEFMRRSLSAFPDLVIGWGTCNAFFGQGTPYLPFRDSLDVLAGGFDSLSASGTISRTQANHLRKAFPLVIQALIEQGPGLINSYLNGSALKARLAAAFPAEQAWIQRIEKINAQDSPSISEQDASRLVEQFTLVLQRVASQHPILIVLDDLQWMDQGTGNLFFHLVRRLPNAPILIAGAFRLEDISAGRGSERHPLEPLLNEFRSSFGKILIDLDQLRATSGRDFTDSYLDAVPNRLDETFRQELYRHTQDHPLYTIQLLRDLQEREQLQKDDQGHWIASPELNWTVLSTEVEGIIGERIGRLDPVLQNLLMTASVEGEQFTVQVLENILGMSERVILHRLSQELTRRHRLVQELGETTVGSQRLARYKFSHALIQQYLYGQLGAAERAALHRETAESLEMLYKGEISLAAAALAHHYSEAGEKTKAVKYLLYQGDVARRMFAFTEAEVLYRQAIAYLKELNDIDQAAKTLMKLYLVYHNSFDYLRAKTILDEYKTLWRQHTDHISKRQLAPSPQPYRLALICNPNFDPGLLSNMYDFELIMQLFYGLVELAEDWNIVPSAATHWDILDDGRRYIFHLRRDMYWSDGVPVTAADFEFALKRILDPQFPTPSGNYLNEILGARDFHQGRETDPDRIGISTPDPFTLEVVLENPCSYLISLFVNACTYAIPKHVVLREGNSWAEPDKLVTNGPFLLESLDRSTGITANFKRNPLYFGEFRGNVDHVSATFYPTKQDRYAAFTRGELDLVYFLGRLTDLEDINNYFESGLAQTLTVPFTTFIRFLMDRPPYNNPDLRRALAMSIDRNKYASTVGAIHPGTGGVVPPCLPGHSPDIGIPYNPAEARRIMDQAGYPMGKDFPEEGLILSTIGVEKGEERHFNFFKQMWKENLGLSFENYSVDLETIKISDVKVCNIEFTAGFGTTPDPSDYLQNSEAFGKTGWRHKEYDALINEARCSFDHTDRMELYRKADRILVEDAVIIPMVYGCLTVVNQPWIEKPTGSYYILHYWKDVTILPH